MGLNPYRCAHTYKYTHVRTCRNTHTPLVRLRPENSRNLKPTLPLFLSALLRCRQQSRDPQGSRGAASSLTPPESLEAVGHEVLA